MSYNQILIRSKDRTDNSTSSSNFIVKLDEKIPESTWRLKSVMMVNSCYNLNSNNNVIYFNENATDKTATVTAGFYDTSSLPTAVKSALDTASGGFATFTVTYSSTTGKLTIASTQNFSLLYGTNSTAGSRFILGYDAEDTTAGTSAVADNVLDLSYPKGINITIDDNHQFKVAGKGQMGSFYLPITTNALDVEVFQKSEDDNSTLIHFTRNLKFVKVVLSDSDGNLVDLNGTNWEMMLEKLTL